jgi:hypothetical protein
MDEDVAKLFAPQAGGLSSAPNPQGVLAAAASVPAALVRPSHSVYSIHLKADGTLQSHMAAGMQQTRHARRLYVGGIGNDATEQEITVFFNDIISRVRIVCVVRVVQS